MSCIRKKGTRNKEFIERFNKVVEGQEGTIVQVEEWGLRDLAYRIEKQGKGFYTLMRYKATGKAVDELSVISSSPTAFCAT